jgi:hypothetical protein
LVRGRDQAALEAIPQSVGVVKGDIGDYADCLKAMQVLLPADLRANGGAGSHPG